MRFHVWCIHKWNHPTTAVNGLRDQLEHGRFHVPGQIASGRYVQPEWAASDTQLDCHRGSIAVPADVESSAFVRIFGCDSWETRWVVKPPLVCRFNFFSFGVTLQIERLWCPNTAAIRSATLETFLMRHSSGDSSTRWLRLSIIWRKWIWCVTIWNRPICSWMSTTTYGCSTMDCFIWPETGNMLTFRLGKISDMGYKYVFCNVKMI